VRPAGPLRPVRSGQVQRMGPLAPARSADRWGPFVEPATIVADLRAGVDARLADLDRAEGRMRYDELDRIAGSAEAGAADLDSELERTVGARRGRREPRPRPGHAGRPAARAAQPEPRRPPRRRADRLRAGRRRAAGAGGGGRGRARAGVRRTSAGGWPAARRELIAARGNVEPALRSRLRVAAATHPWCLPAAGCRWRRWTCSCWRVRRWRRRRTTWPGCRPAASSRSAPRTPTRSPRRRPRPEPHTSSRPAPLRSRPRNRARTRSTPARRRTP
jgi:hypothetical protein